MSSSSCCSTTTPSAIRFFRFPRWLRDFRRFVFFSPEWVSDAPAHLYILILTFTYFFFFYYNIEYCLLLFWIFFFCFFAVNRIKISSLNLHCLCKCVVDAGRAPDTTYYTTIGCFLVSKNNRIPIVTFSLLYILYYLLQFSAHNIYFVLISTGFFLVALHM